MIETESSSNLKEVMIESNSSKFENQRFKSTGESVIDNLLFEIYDKWAYKCRHDSSWDSDTITSASDAVGGFNWRRSVGASINGSEGEQKQQYMILSESTLNQKCNFCLNKLFK